MADGHCFISYSNRDAKEFGPQFSLELEGEHPYFQTWCDEKNIPPGQKWDSVISKAVGDCKCFLFVVTRDSVEEDSICMRELSLALSYKKVIFPICLQRDIELPWRIRDFQKIDLFKDRRKGMAQLRLAIQRIDSPEGQLDALRDRLSAAERDSKNANSEEEKIRAQIDVEDLKKQIQVLEKIVANPQAAQEQTQKNIEAGLERERQPNLPVVGIKSTKFINPPPGIAPNYFQDRTVETKQVFDFLKDDAQRLLTIVGRGGVGKTAMSCRLLKHLENSAIPDDLQKAFGELKPLKVDGIVYLSESGSHRVNFANIFYDLCKLLPKETAQELDAVYKNPQGSTESKTRTLLEKFTGNPIVLLLDNFEPLVDSETFEIRDAELNEALLAFLNGTHTAVNIVITTRIAPQKLNLVQPGRQRPLDLDDGLESPYAENILRDMDSDGRMGLKSAPNELLNRARERTRGYPRALEALFAILASDRYTSLEELLEKPTPENVVQELVGEAFNRLDTNAQKVMQALAVYNRPVTPAAVDYLLAPHIPAVDSAPILQRLANMHFARKESGRFYLHPVDREFAFGLIPEKDLTAKLIEETEETNSKEIEPEIVSDFDEKKSKSPDLALKELEELLSQLKQERTSRHSAFTQHDLLNRAADYFAQARKPRAEWKKLDDLSAQLAEFELRFAAGDYDTAASVLTEFDGEYLLLWGHYRMMIDLHEKLQGKITNKELARISIGNLGIANWSIGKIHVAVKHYEQTLKLAQKDKAKQHEGAVLGNLGSAHYFLGNIRQAVEFYEQALIIAREIGDRRGEGTRLNNLGLMYNDLGDANKAIEFHEQALVIHHEIGDRSGESIVLDNIGLASLNLKNYEKAKEFFIKAIQIADEIHQPYIQNFGRDGLAQAYLLQNDLINAYAAVEAALQYDEPNNNHNATALHGIIALRQEERKTAQEAFTKSMAQADEILAKTPDYYSALDAKGLALCGLALYARDDGRQTTDHGQTTMVDGQSSMVQQAIETFRKARKIAPHAGIVKANLRLFDELMKCEGGEILKDVRNAVEGVE